jgi:uncharacterized membrane protein YhaH (DUF805 family)
MGKFEQYFIDTIKNKYTDFNGRATRSEYWYFVLFYFILSVIARVIDITLVNPQLSLSPEIAQQGTVITGLFSLALLLPQIAVGIRRLHDIGKSGWWYLLILIPILGWLVLIYFYTQDSQPQTNAYGPNPKGI